VALLVPWGGGAGTASQPLAPLLVGLLGAVLSAAAYVTVRDASRTEHEETIVLWFPLTSIPLAVIGTLVEGPAIPTSVDWGWLLFIAAAGQLGQLFLTRGLARVPAGRATLANPLTIAFGAILGWLAFGEPIGMMTLAGGSAIVAAVLLAGSGKAPAEAGPREAPPPA
jgi:drug/metabolite transporter (DMT)-like permease